DYGAPEQMGRRNEPVGPYSDVYGWARTCLYALFQTTQPLLKHWQSIPPSLAHLLEKCLDEDHKNRPSSFKEVLEALNNLRGGKEQAVAVAALEEEEDSPARPGTRRQARTEEEFEEDRPRKKPSAGWSKKKLLILGGSGAALLFLVVVLIVAGFFTPSKREMIVGTWEAVGGDGSFPPGTTWEFRKDGTLIDENVLKLQALIG